ncbi:hypothetical protein AAEU42_00990 [Pseudoflavonifractor phocaeensis]|uniref:hypothetical protein n=1 Tax=Pseudoflavonifractor phocaeensis TaxID=1870988 RepID=UPI00313B155C
MAKACKGCDYTFCYEGWWCDYYGITGMHHPGPMGKGCPVRHEGGLGRRQSPPITERAARLDKERRRAAALKNVRRSKLDGEGALKLYREGLSDRELALAFGMTRGAVTKWRKKRGLAANGAVGRRKG